jgi:hypothetical protein
MKFAPFPLCVVDACELIIPLFSQSNCWIHYGSCYERLCDEMLLSDIVLGR